MVICLRLVLNGGYGNVIVLWLWVGVGGVVVDY